MPRLKHLRRCRGIIHNKKSAAETFAQMPRCVAANLATFAACCCRCRCYSHRHLSRWIWSFLQHIKICKIGKKELLQRQFLSLNIVKNCPKSWIPKWTPCGIPMLGKFRNQQPQVFGGFKRQGSDGLNVLTITIFFKKFVFMVLVPTFDKLPYCSGSNFWLVTVPPAPSPCLDHKKQKKVFFY